MQRLVIGAKRGAAVGCRLSRSLSGGAAEAMTQGHRHAEAPPALDERTTVRAPVGRSGPPPSSGPSKRHGHSSNNNNNNRPHHHHQHHKPKQAAPKPPSASSATVVRQGPAEGGAQIGAKQALVGRLKRLLNPSRFDVKEVSKLWQEITADPGVRCLDDTATTALDIIYNALRDERGEGLDMSSMADKEAHRRLALAWSACKVLMEGADTSSRLHKADLGLRQLWKVLPMSYEGRRLVANVVDHVNAGNPALLTLVAPDMIVALCKSRDLMRAQREFEALLRRKERGAEHMYTCLVSALLYQGDLGAASRALAAMGANNFLPKQSLVRSILEEGVLRMDLRVLHSAALAMHPRAPIEKGLCLQALNIAARRGAGTLARDLFFKIETFGYHNDPHFAASAYNATLQALVLHPGNDGAALKCLNEMSEYGYVVSEGTLRLVAQHMGKSVARLDEAYHTLVDLHQRYQSEQENPRPPPPAKPHGPEEGEGEDEKQPVPTLPVSYEAVLTVLLGCAYASQVDRAFATFEDLQMVFKLQYDVRACNALLLACSRAKTLSVGAAMSVLQEMTRLEVAPDSETYHLALKILIQAGEDPNKVERIYREMRLNSGLTPKPQTFTMFAIWSALRDEHAQAEEVVEEMRRAQIHVPTHFLERLQQIRRATSP